MRGIRILSPVFTVVRKCPFALNLSRSGDASISGTDARARNKTASASLSQETDAVVLFAWVESLTELRDARDRRERRD
jgi:hypothetical protein